MARTRSHLVRMGNSRGVRLPKALIEQAGLADEVELRVRGNTIVVAAAKRPRQGWAEAARQLSAAGEDQLLDAATTTRFDDEDWQW